MTNQNETERDKALVDLRDRLGAVREKANAHLREVADLKIAEADLLAQIRDLGGDKAGTITTSSGAPMFEVTYSKRFDPATAAGILPPAVLADISEMTVSSAKAKRILAPAVYELCQKASTKPTIKPEF